MSELPTPHTAGVGAAGGMFTCEVSPPARLFWSQLPEEEVKGGSSPLASGYWEERNWEGRRRVPGEKGLLKSSREELRIGERLCRGPESRRGRFGVSPSSTWFGS